MGRPQASRRSTRGATPQGPTATPPVPAVRSSDQACIWDTRQSRCCEGSSARRAGLYGDMDHRLAIGAVPLRREQVLVVARAGAAVELTPEARDVLAKSRSQVDALAEGERPTYGISTGFGALAVRY